jgi:hypothetical protein
MKESGGAGEEQEFPSPESAPKEEQRGSLAKHRSRPGM